MRRIACLALLPSLVACDPEPDVPMEDPIGSATSAGKADGAVPVHVRSWSSSTNIFPAALDYEVDANYDAHHCELFLNAFGRGSFSNGGFSHEWLESYLSVPAQDGEILNVGMFVVTGSRSDGNYVMLAQEIEPAYWETGFTFESNTNPAHDHSVESFAFFVDVERPSGTIVRLWQSGQGANYDLDEAFALPAFVLGIGGGAIHYANEGSALFDQKRVCG
jgi:hypothetical protein